MLDIILLGLTFALFGCGNPAKNISTHNIAKDTGDPFSIQQEEESDDNDQGGKDLGKCRTNCANQKDTSDVGSGNPGNAGESGSDDAESAGDTDNTGNTGNTQSEPKPKLDSRYKVLIIAENAQSIGRHLKPLLLQNAQTKNLLLTTFDTGNFLNSFYGDENLTLLLKYKPWDLILYAGNENEYFTIPEIIFESVTILKKFNSNIMILLPIQFNCKTTTVDPCSTNLEKIVSPTYRIATNLGVKVAPQGILWKNLLTQNIKIDPDLVAALATHEALSLGSVSNLTIPGASTQTEAIKAQVASTQSEASTTTHFSGEYMGSIVSMTGFDRPISPGAPVIYTAGSYSPGTSTPRKIWEQLQSLIKNKGLLKSTVSAEPGFMVIDLLPGITIPTKPPGDNTLPIVKNTPYFQFIRAQPSVSQTLKEIGTMARQALVANIQSLANPDVQKNFRTIPGHILYGRLYHEGNFLATTDNEHMNSYFSGAYAGFMFSLLYNQNPALINKPATLGEYPDYDFQYDLYQGVLNLAYKTYMELKTLKPYPLDIVPTTSNQIKLTIATDRKNFLPLKATYPTGSTIELKVTSNDYKFYQATVTQLFGLSLYDPSAGPKSLNPTVTTTINPIDKPLPITIPSEASTSQFSIVVRGGASATDPIFKSTKRFKAAKRNRQEVYAFFDTTLALAPLPKDNCDEYDGKIFTPLHAIQLKNLKNESVNLGCLLKRKYVLVRRYDAINNRFLIGEELSGIITAKDSRFDGCQMFLIDRKGGVTVSKYSNSNFYTYAPEMLPAVNSAFAKIPSWLALMDVQTGILVDALQVNDSRFTFGTDQIIPYFLNRFAEICKTPLD